MNNLKLPAYPTYDQEGHGAVKSIKEDDHSKVVFADAGGFTKLELASLMIAQGLMGPDDYQLASVNEKAPAIAQKTAQTAVLIAKAVLEEANK